MRGNDTARCVQMLLRTQSFDKSTRAGGTGFASIGLNFNVRTDRRTDSGGHVTRRRSRDAEEHQRQARVELRRHAARHCR